MAVVAALAGQVSLVTFPILMIMAGAGDVMTMRIPNGLIAWTSLLFVPFALTTSMPFWLIGLHLATGVVLLTIGYILFCFRWIGGGDAKMLATAGLWLGFPCVLPFLLFSALAGGALAAGIGLWFAASMEAGIRSKVLGDALAPLAPDVPYGFALAAGAILAVPFSWWMAAASIQT